MTIKHLLTAAAAALLAATPALANADHGDKSEHSEAASTPATAGGIFQPESVVTEGQVTVEGHPIAYRAIAGTLIVHPKGWDDSVQKAVAAATSEDAKKAAAGDNPTAEASMFYVAYFKNGAPSPDRPITFFYNGGPGSSTVWLHMGAFGPRRVVTSDDTHTPPAPYSVVDNAFSLLDATDLVFIDAPGTGFSRIAGKDKERDFWGVDPDAHAFSQFILQFLSKYGRWNSPKYLFGESYGTPRSAVVVNQLETDDDVDFNGVILLSQILNFDLSADGPEFNPGTDIPYITALPTYAATAWYHNRVPGGRPADLEAFVKQAEAFATGDYALALEAGAELDPARRQQVAEEYAKFTGLPVDYVLKANLRVNGGMFEKTLQDQEGLTTGRLDTRFSGPDLDLLSKEADYDPQSASISSAYVAAFNDYVRKQLDYGEGKLYRPEISTGGKWTTDHTPPGANYPQRAILNVMPDLANAIKRDPQLKVMVAGGYFDLATPFYEGWYEDHHLAIPAKLQGNIEFHYYPSGHMVYAHEESLKALHDDVAAFIGKTHS